MKPGAPQGSPRFPWGALARPLPKKKRTSLVRSLRGLLRWQRTLKGWPAITGAPDATPFVSLYGNGRLCGCFGSEEGRPGERVARAFLRAMEDARHGGAHRADRGALVAQVSYARDVRRVSSVEEALARIEPGTHGVVLVRPSGEAVILVPSVARDGGTTARALLDALARKAKIDFDAIAEGTLFTFEADEIVARSGASLDRARPVTSARRASLAAEWLSRLVREDGFVHFGVDARARNVHATGIMHHGRAAIVVRALAEHATHAADADRARDWLERDVKAALRGRTVDAWPTAKEVVAGTIALACMAGLPLARELERFVGADALTASPWHAAQVAAVLGSAAPSAVWATCVTSLTTEPWAPWTVVAAHARGDAETLERAATALEGSIRSAPPHEGGTTRTDVPDLALTALTIEALAPLRRTSARAAIDRARRYLARWQFVPGLVPASLEPDLAEGAFPLSPVVPFARGDVTAHALLALTS